MSKKQKVVTKKGGKTTAVKQPKKMPIGKRFPKGVSGNPKGRPPQLLSSINAELLTLGYQRVTPSQVAEAYELLFNLPEAKVKEIINDKDKPFFLRRVAGAMGTAKGMEMIERMLDRAHGKAKTSSDVKMIVETPDEIDYTKLSDAALKEIANAKRK